MARRTKEDALATRSQLLDAAEIVFHAQGVSRTSLHDIAVAAGTTRGAIYWHFKDKADLFNAMMERVTLPLEDAMRHVGNTPGIDPLDEIRVTIRRALHLVTHDAQVRRVFDIAIHQVEYVDELRAVKERHLAVRNECLGMFTLGLRLAARRRARTLPGADMAARGLHALLSGLLQNWLLDPTAFDLVGEGSAAIDIYLRGLGLEPGPMPPMADPAQEEEVDPAPLPEAAR